MEDNNQITINITPRLLPVVDKLFQGADSETLTHIHGLLMDFILSGVIDEKSSLIDLGEYCAELIASIEQGTDPANAAELRKLIDEDIARSS